MRSSTNTLTVRVCSCDREGNMKLCNAEALTARAGLSTGALVAILLCVIILLSEYQHLADKTSRLRVLAPHPRGSRGDLAVKNLRSVSAFTQQRFTGGPGPWA